MAYDINQRFIRLVPGGDGIIYAVQADGLLVYYRHSGWLTGSGVWSNGGGLVIGDGWQQFKTVLASEDGQLFGITQDGEARWYKRLFTEVATGAGSWHPNSGASVLTGLEGFPRMFGGFDGVLYGVDTDGDLHWFKYQGGDGSTEWHPKSGEVIGSGWKQYYALWAGPNGVIFGIRQGSSLLHWWRYLGASDNWAHGGAPRVIGSGFSDDTNKSWFTNTNGTVYLLWLDGGTTPGMDDKLQWFRLLNSESIAGDWSGDWVNGGAPIQVGAGFTVEESAALQGYAQFLSPRQGDTQGIAVSSTFTTVEATVERLGVSGGVEGDVVWGPEERPGRLQLLPGGYRSAGNGWGSDFEFGIPDTWQSGVYVCRLRGVLNNVPHLRWDVPFVVRPESPSAPIAVLLPTNTYNAYNTWAGHNQYTTVGQVGVQRVIASRRPSDSVWIDDRARMSHTFYSDLLLLRWLVGAGYEFDCYQDGDLDADGSWLGHYPALVLGSHPEYWSQLMRDRLDAYLADGGHVVNTGGNAIFERVSYTPDGNAVVFRAPGGLREPFWYRNLGQPTSLTLGADWDETEFFTFGPYEVLADHPFLDGTGLSPGDTFGHSGYNLTGSGWETDRTPVPPLPGTTVIAVGVQNGGQNGAHLLVFDKPGGGWVFATNSIAYNGTLATDEAASRILANAIDAAIS